uniref:Variant surface glycoprotein 1333 n=1 Tax=Trypanosoma brucei TaxID=5691 RepID=M4SYA2_9TRYP|nr:variant surface glycoprotein 1333 [Trypanosoma brucei]
MQAQHLATLFTKLLLIAILAARCAHSAGENAKEFMDMCTLYTLLTQPIPKVEVAAGDKGESSQSPETKMSLILDRMTKMNLTLAPTAVTAHFKATDPTGGWKALPDSHELKVYFGKEADLEQLNKRYDELMATSGDRLRQELKLPLSEATQRQLRKPASHIADQAQHLQQIFNGRLRKLNSARAEARKALITALAGEQTAQALTKEQQSGDAACDPEIKDKDFAWKASAQRDENCKKAGDNGATAGQTLATDVVCLFHSQAGNNNQVCTADNHAAGTEIQAGHSALANANANWKALKAKFPAQVQGHELHLTQATLSEAIAAFKSRLGQNMLASAVSLTTVAGKSVTQPTFYGVYVTAESNTVSCTSSGFSTSTANKGVCIDYTELLKPTKKIPWIENIKKAQKQLQEAEELFGEIKALLSQAHSLQNLM